MNCNDIRDMLSLYIDDELDEEERLLVEEHLRGCEDCRRELDEYKKIIQALRDLPDEEPPLGYCKRLHEKLLAAENEKPRVQEISSDKVKPNKSGIVPRRWMKYAGLAAAVVLVVLVYGMNNLGNFNMKAKYETSYDSASTNEAAPAAPMEEAGSYQYSMDVNRGNGFADEKAAVGSDGGQYGIMSVSDREMKIIKTGSLYVKTENYKMFIENLSATVGSMGGYIESNNTEVYQVFENNNKLMHGNLRIRVPQDRFYEFVDYLEKSSEVRMKNLSETDVTKDYYEKDNRVKNLEVQEEHLRQLFDKANTVEEMLLIENELRRVRTEIDSLNISLSDIDDRASMSTVNLEVEEVLTASIGVTSKDSVWERAREGFIYTVNSIIRSLENMVIYLISASPLLIPFIIVAVIVVFKLKKYIMKKNKL
ncbi:MAG: DUF4349 domain-containing protein [Sedimentibacter sp.]|uniref:DUF4349 domain-containing protein n=1 Tax=Sedimentibacter sp. TaxID=1960295 RepID=UPI003158644C